MTDELAARREARDGTGNLACSCGSQWWLTGGVTVGRGTGQVNGHLTPLTCLECGAEAQEAEGSCS